MLGEDGPVFSLLAGKANGSSSHNTGNSRKIKLPGLAAVCPYGSTQVASLHFLTIFRISSSFVGFPGLGEIEFFFSLARYTHRSLLQSPAHVAPQNTDTDMPNYVLINKHRFAGSFIYGDRSSSSAGKIYTFPARFFPGGLVLSSRKTKKR